MGIQNILKLKHGNTDPRNYTELYVTQLISPHCIRAIHATYRRFLHPAGTNLCLLSAPIIFSVLLLIIQLLINNLVLTGADYECGA